MSRDRMRGTVPKYVHLDPTMSVYSVAASLLCALYVVFFLSDVSPRHILLYHIFKAKKECCILNIASAHLREKLKTKKTSRRKSKRILITCTPSPHP